MKEIQTDLENEYINKINTILRPKNNSKYTVLDLFAGCGGTALGFEAAGFNTHGIEMNEDCCDTYSTNVNKICKKEVLIIDSEFPQADVVIGGPPCQPFSVRGKQKGLTDSRDGFPIFIKAIEKIRPKIWMFENVRGLLYRNKWYLDEILKKLESLEYIIEVKLLKVSDFGVPQNRERVIVVGHKGNFKWPKEITEKVTAGEALGSMVLDLPDNPKFLTKKMDEYIARYEAASKCKVPRDLHLDRPARTLTCRNLAGSTSDMHRIKLPNGKRRRLTVREAARLQSFPDWFEFKGNETSKFNQIGNAVPPLFSYYLAKEIFNYLENEENNDV